MQQQKLKYTNSKQDFISFFHINISDGISMTRVKKKLLNWVEHLGVVYKNIDQGNKNK